MPRPTHFEIHASDPARAERFYTGLFGWKFAKWEGPMPYWLIDTGEGEGIQGGMMQRQGGDPVNGAAVNAYPCTMTGIDNLDNYVNKAMALGGTMAFDKMPIPGMGWLAYVKDTEGNIFGMLQYDEAAK